MTIITPDTSLIGVSQEKTAPESKEQEIPTDPERYPKISGCNSKTSRL
jgi:hypothetical protein